MNDLVTGFNRLSEADKFGIGLLLFCAMVLLLLVAAVSAANQHIIHMKQIDADREAIKSGMIQTVVAGHVIWIRDSKSTTETD